MLLFNERIFIVAFRSINFFQVGDKFKVKNFNSHDLSIVLMSEMLSDSNDAEIL